jgi:hypothetical protein
MRRGKIMGPLAAGCCAFGFLLTGTAAGDDYAITLSAPNCTERATATLRLPSDARSISVVRPRVGDTVGGTKAGVYPHTDLAVIVGVEVSGHRITISASGNPQSCSSRRTASEPIDAPWSAAVDVEANFVRTSQAVFPPVCSADGVVRPKKIIVACADGNFWVSGLRWRHWGSPAAVGLGKGHANNCKPNCAQGRFSTSPATVRLTGLRICHKVVLQYRVMTVRFRGRTARLGFGCDPSP